MTDPALPTAGPHPAKRHGGRRSRAVRLYRGRRDHVDGPMLLAGDASAARH
ncbi:hypothetical protein [Streptomyces olivaceoviridis]|uniref:hypothetical protein n=1 Tax=Streptomyces olivaceoviridis TaxID=1921 RepID=UPI00369ECA0B